MGTSAPASRPSNVVLVIVALGAIGSLLGLAHLLSPVVALAFVLGAFSSQAALIWSNARGNNHLAGTPTLLQQLNPTTTPFDPNDVYLGIVAAIFAVGLNFPWFGDLLVAGLAVLYAHYGEQWFRAKTGDPFFTLPGVFHPEDVRDFLVGFVPTIVVLRFAETILRLL